MAIERQSILEDINSISHDSCVANDNIQKIEWLLYEVSSTRITLLHDALLLLVLVMTSYQLIHIN